MVPTLGSDSEGRAHVVMDYDFLTNAARHAHLGIKSGMVCLLAQRLGRPFWNLF